MRAAAWGSARATPILTASARGGPRPTSYDTVRPITHYAARAGVIVCTLLRMKSLPGSVLDPGCPDIQQPSIAPVQFSRRCARPGHTRAAPVLADRATTTPSILGQRQERSSTTGTQRR